jgi:hypothetical protein
MRCSLAGCNGGAYTVLLGNALCERHYEDALNCGSENWSSMTPGRLWQEIYEGDLEDDDDR